MKLVIDKRTNRITHVFPDDVELTITKKTLITPDFTVANYGEGYCEIVEGVRSVPKDWIGNKYCWENEQITQNSDWEKPIDEKLPSLRERLTIL